MIGNRIRQERQRKGKSLRDVERETGIRFSAIGKIERGERRATSEQMLQLAGYFGQPVEHLFFLDGVSSKNTAPKEATA